MEKENQMQSRASSVMVMATTPAVGRSRFSDAFVHMMERVPSRAYSLSYYLLASPILFFPPAPRTQQFCFAPAKPTPRKHAIPKVN